MSEHTPNERLDREITEGTFCENCGSMSDTFMRQQLEEKVERWQECVNACANLNPAAIPGLVEAVNNAIDDNVLRCAEPDTCGRVYVAVLKDAPKCAICRLRSALAAVTRDGKGGA